MATITTTRAKTENEEAKTITKITKKRVHENRILNIISFSTKLVHIGTGHQKKLSNENQNIEVYLLAIW